MKKYNIAIIGTFDYENFGDLMFPTVFKKQIEKRIGLKELFLFSLNACDMPLNPEKTVVYSIDQLEKVHNEYGIDAIIFGGGDLARLDEGFAPQENYVAQNTSFDLMVYSAIVANKYGIPYIWNCPGVPFEFSDDKSRIVKCLLEDFADYVSVRDARSAEILKDCGCDCEIVVSPDTILSIGTLIEKNNEDIFENLKSEYAFLQNDYIVFQSMINNIDNFVETMREQLLKICELTGKKIVFLPIGNVHNDDVYIKEILAKFPSDKCVTFDRKLNIFEINSVLANASSFIGTSLHGNVVSNAYKVPSIGLNLYDLVKLKNYYRLVGREKYCVKDLTKIYDVFVDMMSQNTLSKIDDAIICVENHFDNIVSKIKSGASKKADIKELINLCYTSTTDRDTNAIVVYYDYGDGFDGSRAVYYKLKNVSGSINLSLNIPAGAKAVRIDPVDNAFCIIKNLSISCNKTALNFTGNYICEPEVNNTLFFLNKDPKIIVESVQENSVLEIKFDQISFFTGYGIDVVMPQLEDSLFDFGQVLSHKCEIIERKEQIVKESKAVIDQKNVIIDQKDLIIEEKNTIIEEKNTIIKEKTDAITNKNAIIEQKDATIAAKDSTISSIIQEKDAVIAEWHNQYNNLSVAYTDIVNSFYWKTTALPRRITSKIKRGVSKNYSLMKVLVFMKGFLRGGIKEGRKRVVSYKAFLERNNNLIKTSNEIAEMCNELPEISDEQRKFEEGYNFENSPKISILVPLYNTPDNFLIEMIDSVIEQTYKNWELCLADGSDEKHKIVGKYCKSLAKKDSRIKYVKLTENKGISDNTNACLKMATGDYIALFDHDDLLHPSVLFEYVKVINDENADFIYCDELTFVSEEDKYKVVLNHHKPEFSPDTLRSYNYICHFTCFARYLYEMVGGFNKEYDGSQDYDLILRLTEKAKNIVRIPKLLYFWRSHAASVASAASAKPYVVNSAEKALAAHLERIGLKGSVKESIAPTTYKIDYEIIGNPKVSILIPSKDHIDDLEKCLSSILSLSTYKNYEIIIVENNSEEKETFDYYKKLEKENDNIKVVTWDKKGFNYSAINNYGASFASGDYILLLNNDIEVITPNWLEEMIMFAQRKDVGAVGAKLYYPDDTIQHAGVILGIGGVAGHSHKYFDRNDYGYMSRMCISQNLSACTAACLLIRKDVFDEVEGLDEGFAVAFNDVDLCMKIRQAGYLIVFTPYAEFYHYESKSRGFEDSPEKVKRFNGEINRFMGKWGSVLEAGDPYYNPNLTLVHENFSLK